MEVTDAVGKWRSHRSYTDEQVTEEKILKVLEAGRRAPSWENVQPWRYVVIRDDEMKGKLTKLAKGQKFVGKAPVVIAVCGDVTAWDKPKNKAALMELMEAGVMKVNEEIIDKVLLNDPVFCVAENGPATILARTFEQLGIAYGFMGLEAVNQGLGMCIVGAFNNDVVTGNAELYEEIRKELAIPEGTYLLALLTLGVPAEDPAPRPRKKMAEIAFRESFSNPIEG